MSQPQALQTLRQFLLASVPSLSDVIFARQDVADAPRPPLPYVTLQVTSDRALPSTPYTVTSQEEGSEEHLSIQHHYVRHTSTVRITYYGEAPGVLFALLRMSKLSPGNQTLLRRGAVKTIDNVETVVGVPISIRPLSDVLDTSSLRDTSWEASGAQDWAMTYMTTYSHDVGTIETVTVDINKEEE